jgi:hypothetical protein
MSCLTIRSIKRIIIISSIIKNLSVSFFQSSERWLKWYILHSCNPIILFFWKGKLCFLQYLPIFFRFFTVRSVYILSIFFINGTETKKHRITLSLNSSRLFCHFLNSSHSINKRSREHQNFYSFILYCCFCESLTETHFILTSTSCSFVVLNNISIWIFCNFGTFFFIRWCLTWRYERTKEKIIIAICT